MSSRDLNDGDTRPALQSDGDSVEAGFAGEMSEFARTLQAEQAPLALLERIAHAAITEVPNARYAGITLINDGRLETQAATDPIVEKVDEAQYETGQGPCIDTSLQGDTTRSDDLSDDPRWPEFAAQAVEIGIRSMLAVRLFVETEVMGALNLYSERPGAFDAQDETISLVLGAHAAVAMAATRRETNLQIALDSRDLIGQAKGILMERYRVDSQQAFDLLVWASQHTHRKLRDVAQTLAETGEI